MKKCVVLLVMLWVGWPGTQGWTFYTRQGKTLQLEVAGSLRFIQVATHNFNNDLWFGPNNATDFLTQSLLRLTAEGHWQKRVYFQGHLVQTVASQTFSSTTGSPAIGTSTGRALLRTTSLQWAWVAESDLQAPLMADRLNLKLVFPNADLTLGRQAINWSSAYFFNPLDWFLPFPVGSFDTEYKIGVDGVLLEVPLGLFTGIRLAGALGRDQSGHLAWDETSLGIRFYTNVSPFDLALQVGKRRAGYALGSAFVGELWRLGVRGEGNVVWAHNGSTFSQVVVGLDKRWSNTLHLLVEYYYHGNGVTKKNYTLALLNLDPETPYLTRHYLATNLSYQFTPLLTGQCALVVAAQDPSLQLAPLLIYSIGDEADFVGGVLLHRGQRPGAVPWPERTQVASEFGSFPDYYFMEVKFYF